LISNQELLGAMQGSIPKSTQQSTSLGLIWYKERQPILVGYLGDSNRCLQEYCHWKVFQL